MTTYSWGLKQPDETLDYQFDLSKSINASLDSVTSATISVWPWGPSELQIESLTVTQSAGSNGAVWLATAWISGGVPGRVYLLKLRAVGAGTIPRKYEFVIELNIDPALATWPPPAIVNADFGDAATWPGGLTGGDDDGLTGAGLTPGGTPSTFRTIAAADITTALGFPVSLTGGLTVAGGHSVTLTTTADSAVTLPVSGTLATTSNGIELTTLPTSSVGLHSGDLWLNNGVLTLIP